MPFVFPPGKAKPDHVLRSSRCRSRSSPSRQRHPHHRPLGAAQTALPRPGFKPIFRCRAAGLPPHPGVNIEFHYKIFKRKSFAKAPLYIYHTHAYGLRRLLRLLYFPPRKAKGKTQYCSFKKNSVRPEPVEGLLVSRWWFDKALLSLSKGSPRTVKRTVLRPDPLLKDVRQIQAYS